jgi:peptide/nickel transport system permease protein
VIGFTSRRVASALVTLFGVSLVVFGAMHLVPGGYADVILGPFATSEQRALLSARFGLDEPLYAQYGRWLAAALRGDFGTSLVSGEPVVNEVARRLPVTVELTVLAAVISIVIGTPIGMLSGWRSGRTVEAVGRMAGALPMSVPDVVIGSVLVYLFSRFSLGLSVGRYVPFTSDPIGNLQAMALPAITLSLFGTALIVRTGRAAVLAIRYEPYLVAALASGRGSVSIVWHHVLRNVAIPLLTVISANVGYLLGGAVVVEVIFAIPGLGTLMLDGIQNRDYALVQAGVLLAAVIFVVLNTLTDISYGLIDPRVTKSR